MVISSRQQLEKESAEQILKKGQSDAIFNSMTPAEHIAAASSALMPNSTLDDIAVALSQVRIIPSSDPETPRALAIEKKLLAARDQKTEQERLSALSPLQRATEGTKIVSFTWTKGGFDSIMMANFTIKNDSPYDIKDIKLRCRHSAPSGTEIDENTRTVYEIVKSHSTRSFRDINMGFIASQVARSGCTILDLKLASP